MADVGLEISQPQTTRSETVEVSIVMPCLNEADTLATCIQKAQRALLEANITGEIIIADNGSTDRSPEIARNLGARVIHGDKKRYCNALIGSINASRATSIVID